MQRRKFIAAGTAAAAALALPSLRAQGLPGGPVRIIVGFAPGGGTDILARVMAQKLTTMWNLPVLVENRAGATGTIAADYVAKQPGDGNTLLMAHINSHAIGPALIPHISYDVERDFAPVMLVGVTPNMLITHDKQTARTIKDVIELCKQNPGKISFGTSGNGSAQHLALEMFKLSANIDAIHVPYKGSGPMQLDLLGAQIDYAFDTMTAASPLVKSGKVIALAQTRLKRAASHPTVPTMAESGFPGFEATSWYGLVGPGKMPAAMARRMNEDLNKILLMPDVIAKFEQYGAEDGGGSAERFGVFIREEAKKWAKVVKDAGVKAEA